MRKDVKDLINKRKIAYVYLLHRMFESSPALLLKVMKIPNVAVEDIQDWDRDYKDAVYETIREEDARGVALKDPHEDVPSIKGIKEKVLRRAEEIRKLEEMEQAGSAPDHPNKETERPGEGEAL